MSRLGVESGLGPKIKFVVLHSNFNFYLRSNSMQALQIVGQHRSNHTMKKTILAIPTLRSIFLTFTQHEPFMIFIHEFN